MVWKWPGNGLEINLKTMLDQYPQHWPAKPLTLMPSISSLGRFKDHKGIIKTPWRDKNGYGRIIIQKKLYYTHRVVAIVFGLPRQPGQILINHINRVPEDDRLENLEWITPSENVRQSHATPNRKSNGPKQSKPVRGRRAGSDEPWTLYPSAKAAARALPIHAGSVQAVISGKQKQTGGFEFEDAATEPSCLEGEEWKPFLTAQVSNMGRYKTCRGVVSKPNPMAYCYSIRIDGKRYAIHRAIGVAFGLLTGLDDERQIDHMDNDPSNNNLANLRVVTRTENNRNSTQHSYDPNAMRAASAGMRSKPIRGRKSANKNEAKKNEAAQDPACLEGERWMDIDMEKFLAANHAARTTTQRRAKSLLKN